MRPRARPSPVLGASDKPGASGFQADIADRGGEVTVVHRDCAEPALPEMPGATPLGVDGPRIAAMDPGQRPPQAVFVGWGQDEMDVVGHQTPRPNPDFGLLASLLQKVAIGRKIGGHGKLERLEGFSRKVLQSGAFSRRAGGKIPENRANPSFFPCW